MILVIDSVLDGDQLAAVRHDLRDIRWQDGTRTAGRTASQVKRNAQADLTTRSGSRLRDRLFACIQSHPVLNAAAQPARFSPLLLSRTEAGGGYGLHHDNAVMGREAAAMRTDLSYTLFLSDPDDYDGGTLTLDLPGERRSFKCPAGSLLLYPSTSLHQVDDIGSGVRLAAVGWIESRQKHGEHREVLFDLENLRATLSQSHADQSDPMLVLGKVIANLKRLLS
ncbi:Fe2+-dependent dioxygenase [uncultured Algimonas sp.]|uniref:Fe2+-dependent dioxygenase n=1 Tax=uncultured Algimonas sp. TaxID=1547920 RepID=UPI00262D965C|nr:Fe2+-dependent dioxygenase [uncultured Algimonas sp.]